MASRIKAIREAYREFGVNGGYLKNFGIINQWFANGNVTWEEVRELRDLNKKLFEKGERK